MKTITVGTRGSALALWQARYVGGMLKERLEGVSIETKVVRTAGDRFPGNFPSTESAKGWFVKEIQVALLEGSIDVAVHSLKDLPTQRPEALTLAAFPARGDALDALIAQQPVHSLTDLPERSRIGTGSPRRVAQLKALRPDFDVQPIRGNVDTRLGQLQKDRLDALVLARAGLSRLGREDQISFCFSPQEMVPAVGQGALAIESRSGDKELLELLGQLDDSETRLCVEAERHFLLLLGGGCDTAIGAHCHLEGKNHHWYAFMQHPDTSEVIRTHLQGAMAPLEMAESAAQQFSEFAGLESG